MFGYDCLMFRIGVVFGMLDGVNIEIIDVLWKLLMIVEELKKFRIFGEFFND